MTYRQGWEWFILPTLESRRSSTNTEVGNARQSDSPTTPEAVDVSEMTEKAAAAKFDRICGGKVYTGERWWEPHFAKWGVK